MTDMDRRSVLSLGFVAVSALAVTKSASAQTYGSTEGKELAPGVRQVDLGDRESLIPAYQKVRMRDIVIQPGSSTPDTEMMNDMVCHLTEGELSVRQNDKQFTAKMGDVWSCSKGINTEGTKNDGSTVAVMRIIDLLTA
jgi:quercetin dioxygenase-like cupin family protein